MRNPSKPLSMDLSSNGRFIQEAAFDRRFDLAAHHFFLRHNGEPPVLSLRDFMARFERAVLFETLIRTNGSQKETADFLKVNKQTLSWKVKKQNIQIIKQITKQPI